MYKKFLSKIKLFLLQGASPSKLAFAVALGISIGIIPLLGVATLLCLLLSLLFRINFPAIQIANYIASPLQLLLYIPFLKTGAHYLGQLEFNHTFQEISVMLNENTYITIQKFFLINLYGIILWLLLIPIILPTTYFICLKIFQKIQRSMIDKT